MNHLAMSGTLAGLATLSSHNRIGKRKPLQGLSLLFVVHPLGHITVKDLLQLPTGIFNAAYLCPLPLNNH
jgi:hypothetical protein